MGEDRCKLCQAPLPDHFRFCPQCGRTLQDASARTVTRKTTPADHVNLSPENALTEISEHNVVTRLNRLQQIPAITNPAVSTAGNQDEATYALKEWQTRADIARDMAELLEQGSEVVFLPGNIRLPQRPAPVVEGTPQIGGAPSVPGIPHVSSAPGGASGEGAQGPHSLVSHEQLSSPNPHLEHSSPPSGSHPPDHQQPGFYYQQHQQPGLHLRNDHQQPGFYYQQHQQPGLQAHHQPQYQPASHLQPQGAVHHPATGVISQKASLSRSTMRQNGPLRILSSPKGLVSTIGTCAVLLAAVAGLILMNQPPARAAQAALTPGGIPVPGGSITIHGSNFKPGGTVTFTADGAPLAYAAVEQVAYVESAMGMANGSAQAGQQVYPTDSPTLVKDDGTFDKTFAVPQDWGPGSEHVIQAVEQGTNATANAQLKLKVELPSSTPTPSP
ncbi:MAG TPA: hypothetical protein VFB12_29085, partial [Ktedonobacteraceae bacterium]|nr:hypothetical protein [Ktedonobacteraceae bacterium]